MAEELKLTDRELALCRGENPDRPEAPAASESANDTPPSAESAAAAVVEDVVAGKDAEQGAKDGAAATSPEKPIETPPAPPAPWYNDQHRQLASQYGMSEADLRDFSSAAEFERAQRIVDRNLANLYRQGQVKQPEAEKKPAEEPKSPLEKIDIEKLKAAGYDDEALQIASRHNQVVDFTLAQQKAVEQMQSQFSQYQNQLSQNDHNRRMEAFHDAVDALGDRRYGKSLDSRGVPQQISKDEDGARKRLYDEADMVAAVYLERARRTGGQMPPLSTILKQANQNLFGEEIRAEERKKVAQDALEQSKLRRPTSGHRGPDGRFTKTTESPLTPAEEANRVANIPELVSMWNKFQEQNGAH